MKKFRKITPNNNDKNSFLQGVHDGIPIALGYLAVAFSLGIAAKNAGLNFIQSFLASALCHASAGEYAGLSLIAVNATYIEIGIMTLIVNARYALMSFAMCQKISPDLSLRHRLLLGYGLTDEIFAITVSKDGHPNPFYAYGAFAIASPCWTIGTALGTLAGNILPTLLVSAFSVTLYGMFLAIFVPKAKESKVICAVIITCFIFSYFSEIAPLFSQLSDGTRTILLTLGISCLAAALFPHKIITEVE